MRTRNPRSRGTRHVRAAALDVMRPTDVFGLPRSPLYVPTRRRLRMLLLAAATTTLLALLLGTARPAS